MSRHISDLESTIAELRGHGVIFENEPTDEGWGIAVKMILPGDVEMLLDEARHDTAI